MAVRARQDDWLYDFDKRLSALSKFISLSEAASLSAACKRVNNLLTQAGKANIPETINEDLLEAGAEQFLYKEIIKSKQLVNPLYQAADYAAILSHLATLKQPIDAYFEQVMVMVDDEAIKRNRLALLANLQGILQGVADISLLQPT
jgi:glycyl-tRNA synthetase beta chain